MRYVFCKTFRRKHLQFWLHCRSLTSLNLNGNLDNWNANYLSTVMGNSSSLTVAIYPFLSHAAEQMYSWNRDYNNYYLHDSLHLSVQMHGEQCVLSFFFILNAHKPISVRGTSRFKSESDCLLAPSSQLSNLYREGVSQTRLCSFFWISG